jgi:hypothetical protein
VAQEEPQASASRATTEIALVGRPDPRNRIKSLLLVCSSCAFGHAQRQRGPYHSSLKNTENPGAKRYSRITQR